MMIINTLGSMLYFSYNGHKVFSALCSDGELTVTEKAHYLYPDDNSIYPRCPSWVVNEHISTNIQLSCTFKEIGIYQKNFEFPRVIPTYDYVNNIGAKTLSDAIDAGVDLRDKVKLFKTLKDCVLEAELNKFFIHQFFKAPNKINGCNYPKSLRVFNIPTGDCVCYNDISLTEYILDYDGGRLLIKGDLKEMSVL